MSASKRPRHSAPSLRGLLSARAAAGVSHTCSQSVKCNKLSLSATENQRVEKIEIFTNFRRQHTARTSTSARTPRPCTVTRGEWTVDETGEVEDIVFFAFPSWLRRGSKTAE